MRALPVFLTLLVLSLLSLPALRAEEHPIFRPAKAGDRYPVSASALLKDKMLVQIGDKVAQQVAKEQEVDFSAKAEVIEVNKIGRPSKTEYTIERFNTATKDKSEALLNPGQVVVGETKDGKRVFTLKEGTISRDAQIVLQLLFGLSDSKYTEDELFSTKNAKGNGSTWQANSGILAEEFKAARLKLTKDDVAGTFKMTPAPKGYAPEALQIIGEITLNNAVPPLPKGMELKHATGVISYAWVLPSDPSKHVLGEIRNSKMSNEITGKTPEDQSMLMKSEIDQKIEIRYDGK